MKAILALGHGHYFSLSGMLAVAAEHYGVGQITEVNTEHALNRHADQANFLADDQLVGKKI
jgi:hypothetical protein